MVSFLVMLFLIRRMIFIVNLRERNYAQFSIIHFCPYISVFSPLMGMQLLDEISFFLAFYTLNHVSALFEIFEIVSTSYP